MRQSQKPTVDIVNEVLELCIIAYPVSSFVISLYKQYGQRGFLSKKQLQGLLGKASEIPDVNPAKIATLEALIKKMPNRFKSELPEKKAKEDDPHLKLLEEILNAFPEHKAANFLIGKIKNGESLNSTESADVHRFYKFVKKKIN